MNQSKVTLSPYGLEPEQEEKETVVKVRSRIRERSVKRNLKSPKKVIRVGKKKRMGKNRSRAVWNFKSVKVSNKFGGNKNERLESPCCLGKNSIFDLQISKIPGTVSNKLVQSKIGHRKIFIFPTKSQGTPSFLNNTQSLDQLKSKLKTKLNSTLTKTSQKSIPKIDEVVIGGIKLLKEIQDKKICE